MGSTARWEAHPHIVHSRGKVVDGARVDRRGFVDNPVSGLRAQAYRSSCPRGRRRNGAEAIASRPLHPVGEITSSQLAPRSEIASRSGALRSQRHFVHRRRRLERATAVGARKDVTGIPVSVLLPGVEG